MQKRMQTMMQTGWTYKFIMAVLAITLFVMMTGIVSNMIFDKPVPQQFGYVIELPQTPPPANQATPAVPTAPPAILAAETAPFQQAAPVAIEEAIAVEKTDVSKPAETPPPAAYHADAARGETLFRQCIACHAPRDDGRNRVGPHLVSIIDRPAAAINGFGYSTAMKEFAAAGNVWTEANLDAFLASPRHFIKGTAMGYAGMKNAQDRADLIAYLATLSDKAP